MKKGIIFDLDGTLWDSTKEVVESWNSVFERYENIAKRLTIDEMKSYMGKTLSRIAELCLPNLSQTDSLKILNECCKVEIDYLRRNGALLYSNENSTFKALLRDFHLYIVSNCQCGYIESFLESSGYKKHFDDIECHGNTGKNKAENIKLICERNKLSTAIYVGDTQLDFESASEAGIPFVHAAYGFGKVEGAKYVIEKFSDLPDVIHQIEKDINL